MKSSVILIALLVTMHAQENGGEALTLGNSKHAKLIHFADAMFTDDCLTFEIGQLIPLKGKKVKVNAVSLYLFDSPRDSMTFNVRFYRYKDGKPTERITNHEIYQSHAIKEGWLKMDLTEYDLRMNDDFVVALEVE